MSRILLAGAAALAGAWPTPAAAGSPYVGIDAGLLVGRPNDIDEFADFTTRQMPAIPPGPAGLADQEFDDVFSVPYEEGYEVNILGGYDFGPIRVEVELGRKQAGLGDLTRDDIADSFIDTVNEELNRPSTASDPGAPGLPALSDRDFDLSGKLRVHSAMINGLLDISATDRITAYGGGGYGRSSVRALGDKDSATAWQYIIGVRYKLSDRVELGIKHRYFNSGVVRLRHDGVPYAGNPDRVTITPPNVPATDVDQTTNVLLRPEIEGRFRSRSFLASLIYTF